MKVTLVKISDKLMELNDRYANIYPDFYMAELKYVSVKARLMQQEYPHFGSQPSRDAAVEALLEQTPEYVEFHKLNPEINTLNTQIRIYMQLAKNLVAGSWEVGNG